MLKCLVRNASNPQCMDEEAQTTDGSSLTLNSFKNTYHNHIIMCLQTTYYSGGRRPSGKIAGICLAGPLSPSSRVFNIRSRTGVLNRNRMRMAPPPLSPLRVGGVYIKEQGPRNGLSVVDSGLKIKKWVLEMCQGITGLDHQTFHFFLFHTFVFSMFLNMGGLGWW